MGMFATIPDLVTDSQIVQAIDELKHRLKTGADGDWGGIRGSLNSALNRVIEEHDLGGDPHMHAQLPDDGEDMEE